MLKKKIFVMLALCASLLLFGNNESYAVEGSVVGYPEFNDEGMSSYPVLVRSLDNLDAILYIGDFSGGSEEFEQCFNNAFERKLEVVVTGNIEPYDSPYIKQKIVLDKNSKCVIR